MFGQHDKLVSIFRYTLYYYMISSIILIPRVYTYPNISTVSGSIASVMFNVIHLVQLSLTGQI